jgi:hypothetical protein
MKAITTASKDLSANGSSAASPTSSGKSRGPRATIASTRHNASPATFLSVVQAEVVEGDRACPGGATAYRMRTCSRRRAVWSASLTSWCVAPSANRKPR